MRDRRTILILSANPKGTNPLRLGEEIREIKEGLRRSKYRDLYQIETAEAVRVGDIQRAMLDYEPNIVHFCGHGGGQEGLVFEDVTGQIKLVSAEALAGLFSLFADRLDCVLLNACYSEIQAKAISRQINSVIGMSQAIGDKAAIAFAVGFYDALGADRDIDFAYKYACNGIDMEGIQESDTPKLLKGKAKKTIILAEQSTARLVNPFGDVGCITDPKRFFDREELMRQVFEELDRGVSISLVGESQIGKSSILSNICHQGQRQILSSTNPEREFIYLSLQLVANENDFYQALCHYLRIPFCRGYDLTLALRNRYYVLCLDEVEKMAWDGFTKQLRSHLRGLADGANAPLTLVIASRSPLAHLFPDSPELDSPLAGICYQLDVKPFSEAVVRDFLSHRLFGTGVTFSEVEITELFLNTRGHPARLQREAANLYRSKCNLR